MDTSNVDYDKKFKEMQSYLPILDGIISKIENTENIKYESIRGIHLPKIKSLKSLLSGNSKRMKMENLLRCEQVLKKIKDKSEKNTLETETVKETKSITPSHEKPKINENNIKNSSNSLELNTNSNTKNSVNDEKSTSENVNLELLVKPNFYQELPSCSKTSNNDSPENTKNDSLENTKNDSREISLNSDLQTCREKLKEITKLTDICDVEKSKPYSKEIQLVTEAYIISKNDSKSFSKFLSESISNISKNVELPSRIPEINNISNKNVVETLRKEDGKISSSDGGKAKLSMCYDRISVKNMLKKCNPTKFEKKDFGLPRESRKDWKKNESYSPSKRFENNRMNNSNTRYDDRYSKSRSKSKDSYSSHSPRSRDYTHKKGHEKRKKSHNPEIHSSNKNVSNPKIKDKLLDITSSEKLEEKTDLNKLKKLRKRIKKQLQKESKELQDTDVMSKITEECEFDKDENDQISLLYNNIIDNLNESENMIEEKSPKSVNSSNKLSLKDSRLSEVDLEIFNSNNEKLDSEKANTFGKSNLKKNSDVIDKSEMKSKISFKNISSNSETKSENNITCEKVANVLKDLDNGSITDNFTKKYLEDAIKLGEFINVKQPSLDTDILKTNDQKVKVTHTAKDDIHYFCDKDHNLHPQIEQEVLSALKDDLECFPDMFTNKLSKKEDVIVKPKIKEHLKDGNVNEQNKLEQKSRRISLEEYKEKMQKESSKKVDTKSKDPIDILNRVLTPKEIERFDSVIQTTVEESLNDSEIVNAENKSLMLENDGSESSEFLGPESPDSNSSFKYEIDRSPQNVRQISEIQELQDPDTNDQDFFDKGNSQPWLSNEIPNKNICNISPQRINNDIKIIPNKEIQNTNCPLDKNGSNINHSKNYNAPEFESKKRKRCRSRNRNDRVVEEQRNYFPNLTNRFNVNFPVSANYRGKNPKPILGTNPLPIPVKNSNVLNKNPELISGKNPYKSHILEKPTNTPESPAPIPYILSHLVMTFCPQNVDNLPIKQNRKSLLDSPIDKNPGTLTKNDSLAIKKIPLLPEPDCPPFHHVSVASEMGVLPTKNSKFAQPTQTKSVSSLDPRLKKYDVNQKDETLEKLNIHGSVQNTPNVSHITSGIINVAHNDPRIKHIKEKSDLSKPKERNLNEKDNQAVKAQEDSDMKNDENLDSRKGAAFKIPKMKKDESIKNICEESTSKSNICTSKDDMNTKPKKMNRDVVILDETETFVIYDEMITYEPPSNKNDINNDDDDDDCVIIEEKIEDSENNLEKINIDDCPTNKNLKDTKYDDNATTIDDSPELSTENKYEKHNDCENKASVNITENYEDKDDQKDFKECLKDDLKIITEDKDVKDFKECLKDDLKIITEDKDVKDSKVCLKYDLKIINENKDVKDSKLCLKDDLKIINENKDVKDSKVCLNDDFKTINKDKDVKDSKVCLKDDLKIVSQTFDSPNIIETSSKIETPETEVKEIKLENLVQDTTISEMNIKDITLSEAKCDKISRKENSQTETNIKNDEDGNLKNENKNIENSKENNENDELFHNLADFLQNKQKMLEMINRASQGQISQKLKKKLELLSQLDSDDEAEENNELVQTNSDKEIKANDSIQKKSIINSCISSQNTLNIESENSTKISSTEDTNDNIDNSTSKIKCKPKNKFRNEVALLREALPEVFINSGGLQPAGIRMCRLVKELSKDPTENRETKKATRQKATEKPLKSLSPSQKASNQTKSPLSNTDKIKQPVILLEKTPLDTSLEESTSSISFESQSSESSFVIDESFESKNSEDLDSSYENVKPCPKSKKKYFFEQETDSQEVIESNMKNDKVPVIPDNINEDLTPKPSGKKFIKKRKKPGWSTGHLKKKTVQKPAKNKLKNDEITESSWENTDVDSIFSEKNDDCSDSIEYNSDKDDAPNLCNLMYHFVNETIRYKCLLCNYDSDRYIVKHYKLKHPKHEVLISRLNPKEAKLAIDEASGIKIDSDDKLNPRYDYRCRFCQKYSYTFDSFYKHIILNHTGEYNLKTNKGLINFGNESKYSKMDLSGHICSICNYTQVSKDNIEKHFVNYHPDQKCEIVTINLSSISISKDKIENAKNVNDVDNSEVDVQVYLEDDDKKEFIKEPSVSSPCAEVNESDGVFSLSGNASMLSNEYESLNITEIGEFKIKEELVENEKDFMIENTDLSEIADIKPEPHDIPPVKNFFERFGECTEITSEKDNTFERKLVSIGELNAKLISKTKTELICKINRCIFACSNYSDFMDHINSKHVYEMWNGFCKICNKTYELSGYDLALNHLMKHINPSIDDLLTPIKEKSETFSDKVQITPKINVRPMHHLLSETFCENTPNETTLPRIENVMSLNPDAIQNIDNVYELNKIVNQDILPKPKKALDVQKEVEMFYFDGIRMNYSNNELFQCAACPMFTDTSESFLNHCKQHLNDADMTWRSCAYCKLEFETESILVDHIVKKHSNSHFVCKFCYFRSTSYIVTFQHTLVAHSDNMILCDRVRYSRSSVFYTQIQNSNLLSRENCVPTYICTHENFSGQICNKKFYSSEMFLAHTDKSKHSFPMCCQYCRKEKMQPLKILWHLRQFHHYNLYRCAYCLFGTDIPVSIVDHLKFLHYAEPPIYYCCKSFLEKPEENSSETSSNMVEKVDLNNDVRHHLKNIFDLRIENDGKIVKCPKRKCDKLSLLNMSANKPNITSSHNSNNRKSNDSPISVKNKQSFSYPQGEIVSNDSNLFSKIDENNRIFNKTEKRSLLKINENHDNNQLLKETTVENLILDNDKGKRFSDSKWQLEPKKTDECNIQLMSFSSNNRTPGLFGKTLFRCGFHGCSSSFETPDKTMISHLEHCEKRTSDNYICYHCNKSFKKANSLIAHIPFHGQLRYTCAICAKRFEMRVQCVSHMKFTHNSVNMESVPVDPLKLSHYTDHFVVYAVDNDNSDLTDKNKCPRRKSNESNPEIIPVKLDRFRPEDILNLPHERILNEMIYCANCSYSTKVTSNMLRHLKQHTSEQFVPTLAPVNPVPHLHTNEMHFDKMTNLALSSNIDRNPIRRSSLTKSSNFPQFVPEKERFVCGSDVCRYTSVSEKMLQKHWNTLHTGETLFRCLHCLENIDFDTEPKTFSSRIWTHLRLHGEILYNCNKCKFCHYSLEKIQLHKEEVHQNLSNIDVLRFPSTKEVVWKCKLCSFTIDEKEEIISHCISEHKGLYQCGLCSSINKNRGHMILHFKKQHPGINKTFSYNYEKYNKFSKIITDSNSASKRRLSVTSEDSSQMGTVSKKPKISQNDESPKNHPLNKSDKLKMPFGGSRNGEYLCPFCLIFTTKESSFFRVHLYEELNYRTWCCRQCGYKSFDAKRINLHSLDEHRSASVPTRSNFDMNVEGWVENCIIHQEKDMQENITKISIEPSSSSKSKNDIIAEDDFDEEEDKLIIYLEEEGEDEKQKEKNDEKEKESLPITLFDKKIIKVNNEKILHKCKYCDYTSISRANIRPHEKRHWLIQPFQCSICPKQFVAKKELMKHHNSFHPLHPYKTIYNELPDVPEIRPLSRKRTKKSVTIDPQIRKSQRNLIVPDEKSETEKNTDTLKETNPTQLDEDLHDLNMDSSEAFSLKIQKEVLFYDCSVCNSKFSTNKALSDHFKNTHQNQDVLKEALEKFLCIYCENKFEDFALLMDHHMMCHMTRGIGIYPLNFAQIQDTGEIKSNFDIQKGSYDCIISACKMNFENLHAFKTHVRNHYYIYKCELCMESFQFSSPYFEHCKKVHNNKNLPKSSDNKQSEVLDRISQIDRLIFHLVDLYKNQSINNVNNPEVSDDSTSLKVKQTARKSTASLMNHKKIKTDDPNEVFNAKKLKLSDPISEKVIVKQEDDDDNDVLIIDC